jgi:MFS family permease
LKKDGEKSALVAISFVGLLIGGLACGAAADKFGRKKSLIFALGVNGIFGLASAFTSKVWALVLMRFLSGVGYVFSFLIFENSLYSVVLEDRFLLYLLIFQNF